MNELWRKIPPLKNLTTFSRKIPPISLKSFPHFQGGAEV